MSSSSLKDYLSFSTSEKKIDQFLRYAMPSLAILSLLGFGYFFWILITITNQYAQEIALRDAIRFHNAVNLFRDYYSTRVVANLQEADVEFTHDYHEKNNAIPLPATLTRELGTSLSNSAATSMNFYSDYPFPWREFSEELDQDKFLAEALIYLRQNPDTVYYRTEFDEESGQSVLRYATPSIMKGSCVDCHNSHPDSPKKDWQIGDVRGVLEVSVPVTYVPFVENISSGSNLLISGVLLLLSALGLSAAGFYYRSFSLKAIELRSKMLEDEVIERKSAEKRYRAATLEAQNANKAKSNFLATMSHELRTPLNAIIGYSELLEEEAIDENDFGKKEDLERITRSGRHLLTLINDILDLSKIEAGKLDVYPKSIEVSGIVKYVNDIASILFADGLIDFQIDVGDAVISVYSDETRLKQIIFNLLSNASKFTEQGSVVLRIDIIKRGFRRFVMFEIADTGIGISDSDLEELFTPFVQGDSDIDRKYAGSGLGMAITKNLVELLSGEIQVLSDVGKGSTFTVLLPYQEDDYELLPDIAELAF